MAVSPLSTPMPPDLSAKLTHWAMVSPKDRQGRLVDNIHAGFLLAKNGDVYEVKPQHVGDYEINMPFMDTLFVVVDRPDEVRLCGRRKDSAEYYCSCAPTAPDNRRCAHLWAADIYLFHRGTRMSRGTQLHANVFDGRYPELRVYDCLGVRRVDPLADIEGITVFKLLPLCGVFMELFDRLTLSSPPFRQFRRVATEIVSGKQPSMAELNTSLKSNSRLKAALAQHDPAFLIFALFRHFDAYIDGQHFGNLLRWSATTNTRCTYCGHFRRAMDQLEGWKIMIVPTAVEPCVGPSGTRTGSRSRATSVIGLAREGRTQYRHLDCKACRLYTLHKVEQIPQSNGKLMLFDVQLHPRTAFTRDFTIPLSFTAASDHTTFTLVGFLIQDVQSQGVAAGNGFSRVSYSDGSFWEHVGQHKVGYTIGADPKRTPCLVLYQRASLVRKPTLLPPPRSVTHTKYPTKPLLSTTEVRGGRRRLSI